VAVSSHIWEHHVQLSKTQIKLLLTATLIVVIFILVVIFVTAFVLTLAMLGDRAFLGRVKI
jgi:hypothetical protein